MNIKRQRGIAATMLRTLVSLLLVLSVTTLLLFGCAKNAEEQNAGANSDYSQNGSDAENEDSEGEDVTDTDGELPEESTDNPQDPSVKPDDKPSATQSPLTGEFIGWALYLTIDSTVKVEYEVHIDTAGALLPGSRLIVHRFPLDNAPVNEMLTGAAENREATELHASANNLTVVFRLQEGVLYAVESVYGFTVALAARQAYTADAFTALLTDFFVGEDIVNEQKFSYAFDFFSDNGTLFGVLEVTDSLDSLVTSLDIVCICDGTILLTDAGENEYTLHYDAQFDRLYFSQASPYWNANTTLERS